MVPARPLTRLVSVFVGAAAVAIGISACGTPAPGTMASANNNGAYVQAGPITYQLQISRPLNQFSVEDRTYLTGVTAPQPGPTEEWYGVFLWAKNQTHRPALTNETFDIVDTARIHYYPIPINAAINPYAWTVQTLNPLETQPTIGSTAFYGPTGGSELLFKINASAYANRPLTLEIHVPGVSTVSTISLDL
jgi:hypothetical protein